MAKLWLATLVAALLAFLFYGAGCTRSAIGIDDPDGGSKDCKSLDEKGCAAAGSACVADYCSACACTASFVACRRPSDPIYQCPLYDCAQPLCDCTGLPESVCLAEQPSLGCRANYCPDCQGGQFYTGCSNPGSGDGACPASCPIFQCRTDGDCKNGQFCLAPGAFPGCGVCRDSDCTADANCAPGQICAFDSCVCTNSGLACQAGCNQTGCPEGQTCGQTNHCIPQWCQKPNDCPAGFECSSNQCQRKLCNDDSMCGGVFCVENQCYSSLGTCQSPVP